MKVVGLVVGLVVVVVKSTEDVPTWTDETAAFNCTLYDRPLQVLRRSGESTIQLAQLDLTGGGSYNTLHTLLEDEANQDRVNAGAMYYSRSTRQAWLFAMFREGTQVRVCRWDYTNDVLTRTCIPGAPPGGFANTAAIVNQTYYYSSGVGGPGSAIRMLHDIHTDSPYYQGAYFFGGSPSLGNQMRAFDLTHITREGCSRFSPNCVTTDYSVQDDPYGAGAEHYLITIANNANGLILVALDDHGTPMAYLYVLGLNVIRFVDNAVRTDTYVTSGTSVSAYGSTGACWTIFSPDGTIARVLCSSNKGLGLFEVQLPLDLGPCRNEWNDFDSTDTTVVKECDRRPEGLSKPVIGYVADSAITNQNDGLNCLYSPAAEEISSIIMDPDTIAELAQQTDTLPPTTSQPSASPSSVPFPQPTLAPIKVDAPTRVPVPLPTSSPVHAPTPVPTPIPSGAGGGNSVGSSGQPTSVDRVRASSSDVSERSRECDCLSRRRIRVRR